MTKLASVLVIVGLTGITGVAHANAFLLNEFDAQAVGRGNASTATDTDASSIYYNVGGLAAGEGTQVVVGGGVIQPSSSFTDASSKMKTDSTTSTQVVPGLFASTHITSMFAAGIGFYTPFGLALSWPAGSEQAASAQEIALHTFFITPSFGANLGSIVPGLSVGAGIDIVPATIELKQAIFFGTDTAGSAHLGATATGIGGRIGVMWRPQWQPRLSLGVMWRSDVKEDFSGTGNFNASPVYRGLLPPDGDVSTSLTLPQTVSVGAGYRPIDDLEVEADVVWTNWSKFKELAIQLPASMAGMTTTTTNPENYDNTTSVRLGGEYRFPRLGVAARAGFIYDPTPVPATSLTPQLPDVDRIDLTLGGSKTFGKYGVHVGLLWVLPSSRSTSNEPSQPELKGSYDVSAFVATVSLTGRFNALY